jgi:hypothetical protein
MAAINAEAGPEGFEQYTFECARCGLRDVKIAVSDPLKSDAAGWVSGECGHGGASATHDVQKEQSMPRTGK